MTTFNTAAAPKAPAYVANLWQMEVNVSYIRFKFKTEEAAAEMHAETKNDKDPMIAAVSLTDKVVAIHYNANRSAVQCIAKAISEAYGIEMI